MGPGGSGEGSPPITWQAAPVFLLLLSLLVPTLAGPVRLAPDFPAALLAPAGSRADETEFLATIAEDRSVDRHEILRLRQLVVYTGEWTPPTPDEAMLRAHIALLEHPDPRVRREALEGLHPWLAGTPFDPLPMNAPMVLDGAALDRLLDDPDPGVRKRLARILRDARPAMPRDQVRAHLERLLRDPHAGVRRTALVALPDAVDREVLPAVDAWAHIVGFLPRSRPDGRAACNQLARMRSRLARAGAQVDVEAAFEQVLRHHPERGWRVWSAWRRELPVREAWMARLLDDTVGLDRALIRHWHETAPEVLDRALERWQATRHPERRDQLEAARGDDSLSDPKQPPSAR